MEQNLILHGVDNSIEIEDSKAETPMYTLDRERCKYLALKFFQDIMKIKLDPEGIWKSHRTGSYHLDKVLPLVLKVSYGAKDLIMEHLSP